MGNPSSKKRREWRSAPVCRVGGRGERERNSLCTRGGGRALWPLFWCFFIPTGPALCRLGLVRSAALPEGLTRSSDLPLTTLCSVFTGFFPSLSFSHCHFGLLSPAPNKIMSDLERALNTMTGVFIRERRGKFAQTLEEDRLMQMCR